MKTNQIIAVAAALFVFLLVMLFFQQSELENDIASLRSDLSHARAGQKSASDSAQTTTETWAPVSDTQRVGKVEPISDEERIAAAHERLADLERVANGQADILENLVAEKERQDEAKRKAAMRSWGPEQATGAPDTMTAGDQRTAWAPAVADGGVEWLEAEFASPADLAKIVVRQTCNPGCITKVVAISDSGAEIPVWAGVDPSTGQALADTPFAVPSGVHAKRVKVYLDTSKVAGWEEIDAMQIVGRDGTAQWAKSVNSSSTYASGRTTLSLDGADTSYDSEPTLRLTR